MEWYEAEVRELEQMRFSRQRPPVFYGSSSFRMWSTLAEDVDPAVLNMGFGGSTLEACDYFFARLIPPRKPRSLLLYAGDNDLGDGRSVEQALGWFRSLADKVPVLLGDIPFGFVSVKPSPARYELLDRIRRLNELVHSEMDSRPAGFFVDLFPEMLDKSGKPRPELFLDDGLHLSREGYCLWSRALKPFRNQILTV